MGMQNPLMMMMSMMYPGMMQGFGKRGYNKVEPEKKVKVEGLPSGVSWKALKDHMRQAGSVEFVKTTGTSGEVRYNTKSEAKKAVDMLNGSAMEQGGIISVQAWE